MSIPVPSLDTRSFQDLVDEAKRRISDRCPEWTDHNVSDPGVTLIELFAQMTDETIYRLNRVPDKLLRTVMNTIGIRQQSARAASTALTFWLSAPTRYWSATTEDTPLLAPAGVEVSTERTSDGDRVSFRTTRELRLSRAQVVGRHLVAAGPQRTGGELRAVEGDTSVEVFGPGAPAPGSAFVVQLARPLPGCAVRVELACEPNRGTGIEPDDPPLQWEAWGRGTWQRCEVDRDTTGGLNRPGNVFLHVPPEHADTALTGAATAGWLRCRVLPSRRGQSAYEQSPAIGRIGAETIGVSVDAGQADVVVRDEVVGVSDGVYGQPPFTVRNVPVLDDGAGGPLLYAGDDPVPWTPVPSFESSDEDDRHYLLDRVGGQLRLGVAIRQADGRVRRYGAVPPASAVLRLAEYRVGGGLRGNVRATSLRVLRSPVPHVRRVENRHAATGGVNAETVEQTMARVPLFLARRTRAVTLEDFAVLAREADDDVARTHALSEGDPTSSVGVRVLVVPKITDGAGLEAPLDVHDLTDVPETMTAVAQYLDSRRMVGVRVLVTPPRYLPVRITASLSVARSADPRRVEQAATRALYRLLHPLVGGDDHEGWPFGMDLQVGDVYAVLQPLDGVRRVVAVALSAVDGSALDRLVVPQNGLPLSLGHTVVLT